MSWISRRSFVTLAASGGILTAGAGGTAANSSVTGMTLKEALERRRSTRLYAATPVADEQVGDLLWSAFGINRPDSGGRTAPSWRTSYGTDIYVADAKGVHKVDPANGALMTSLAEDIRGKASPQPFVATAPLVLIYVADLARMAEAPREDQIQAAHVDAGIIAQNVYLYCAASGLGTCLVGGADKPALTKLLSLPETQIVTFVQPVGHPKQAG